jgi:hypothetical protein
LTVEVRSYQTVSTALLRVDFLAAGFSVRDTHKGTRLTASFTQTRNESLKNAAASSSRFT